MAYWTRRERRNGTRTDFEIQGRIFAADLTAAGLTQTIDVPNWPPNSYKGVGRVVIGEYFHDTGLEALTDLNVTIGDDDVDGLMTTVDVSQAADAGTATTLGADGTQALAAAIEPDYEVNVYFTAVASNLDLVDQGMVNVYLTGWWYNPKQPASPPS